MVQWSTVMASYREIPDSTYSITTTSKSFTGNHIIRFEIWLDRANPHAKIHFPIMEAGSTENNLPCLRTIQANQPQFITPLLYSLPSVLKVTSTKQNKIAHRNTREHLRQRHRRHNIICSETVKGNRRGMDERRGRIQASSDHHGEEHVSFNYCIRLSNNIVANFLKLLIFINYSRVLA